MSEIAMEAARLLNLLPEADQTFAYEFIKKLVLAWDPDYTKLTAAEAAHLDAAEASGFVDAADIDWDNLDKID